jgi:hypothetical protein
MTSSERGFVDPLFLGLVGVFALILLIAAGLAYVFGDDVKDVPVSPGECQCTDQADIKSRIAEATAARDAFAKSAADRSANEDGRNLEPEMYSDEAKQAETDAVHPAVKAATTARTAHAKTRSDCTTEVDEKATPCLRAALQIHENVHSLTCQAMKKDGRVGFMRDYKFQMTMVTFLRNEVAGYDAEINYLNGEMARLKADGNCNWVVVETYRGPQSKEDQQQRLARSRQRVANYVKIIS